jgi:hypothetical protein
MLSHSLHTVGIARLYQVWREIALLAEYAPGAGCGIVVV